MGNATHRPMPPLSPGVLTVLPAPSPMLTYQRMARPIRGKPQATVFYPPLEFPMDVATCVAHMALCLKMA